MPEAHSRTHFEFNLDPIGRGWRVVARLPSGRIQYIGGFESEADAKKWIAITGPSWRATNDRALSRI